MPCILYVFTSLLCSRAVAAYLCNKLADSKHKFLYPEDPKDRAEVDMLLYLGETVFDAMNKWMVCIAISKFKTI